MRIRRLMLFQLSYENIGASEWNRTTTELTRDLQSPGLTTCPTNALKLAGTERFELSPDGFGSRYAAVTPCPQ
jgi:hypothetical protein